MKTNLLAVLDKMGLEIESSMVEEVLKYVEVEDTIEIDEILEHLDVNNLDYSGACHEQIDGMVDVYYHDLEKWVVGNSEWIEQAISDGLCDGKDLHKSIQAGQYLYYSEEFYKALETLVNDIKNI